MTAPITLIIAHHQLFFKSILDHIFRTRADICVVANVESADALVAKIKELKPAVVLVSLLLPGMGEEAAWPKLAAYCGPTKIVISWPLDDAEKVPAMIPLLGAGFIAGNATPVEYVYAVKQAAKGNGSHCSQTQVLLASPNTAALFTKNLDNKWLEMIYCITIGYSIKEAAEGSELKESTVKSYLKKLKHQTGYRSMAALEKMLKRKG